MRSSETSNRGHAQKAVRAPRTRGRSKNGRSLREIPRWEWTEFVQGFAGTHHRMPATLELLDEHGRSTLVTHLELLEGVEPHLDGDTEDTIHITLEGHPGGELTHHVVRRPCRVFVGETPEHSRETLRIEEDDGSAAVVRLHATVAPESVDALP